MRAEALAFPPLVKEGQGWAGKPPHRQRVRFPPVTTSGNDAQYRPATPRTRRRPHRSIAPSTSHSCCRRSPAHPLCPPFARGEKRGHARGIRAANDRIPQNHRSGGPIKVPQQWPGQPLRFLVSSEVSRMEPPTELAHQTVSEIRPASAVQDASEWESRLSSARESLSPKQ
jgi:hypothetical protein